MKKIIYILILNLVILSGCSVLGDDIDSSILYDNSNAQNEFISNIESDDINSNNIMEVSVDNSIGDNITITRAMAAKMLALVHNTPTEISTAEKQITFTDVPSNSWYYEYVNTVYISNLMVGDGENFNPNSPLSFNDANALLNRLVADNNLTLNVTSENMDSPISYALWCQLYEKILEDFSGSSTIVDEFSIYEKDITILATSGNNSQLIEYFMITDKGPMSYSGLYLDNFIDNTITVKYKDNEIIYAKSFNSKEATLENCYIVSNENNLLKIFTGGAERSYNYVNSSEDLSGKIASIQVVDNYVTSLTLQNEIITGSINLVNSNKIEINTDVGSTSFELDANAKIYSISTGVPLWFSVKDLIIGSNVTDFVIHDDKIISAIIKDKATPSNIRVVLNTSDYSGLTHNSVSVTSNENYIVDTGAEKIKVEANNAFTVSDFKNSDLMGQERISIYTENPGGKITVLSIERNWTNNESPMYRGTIEISKADNGYYIVNELPFEEYLYAVVPSEMPTSYGLEPAKVQAITARSYAYNQFFENKYYNYGANVDDSVLCQVYNNIPENNISIDGVNATLGQCLTYEGSVITANFFSTSSGYTANNGEVWADFATSSFPSNTLPYLSSVKQFTDISNIYDDLSNEETANAFYKDMNVDSFDKDFGWFRWNVTMSMQEIENSINNNLSTRYHANKNLILTLTSDNSYKSIPVETIGELENIEVFERSKSGGIMSMKITGSENTIIVSTEYNIRMLIKPYQYDSTQSPIVLNLKNGSTLNNYALMPSGFFTMEYDSETKKIAFYGGGNGHGVGMSQNGVKSMVDKGFSVNDILTHYYPNCEISKII